MLYNTDVVEMIETSNNAINSNKGKVFKNENIDFGYDLSYFINSIDILCKEHKIDESHGLNHAIKVKDNGVKIIESWDNKRYNPIPKEKILIILLACLLHDVDDRKYFNSPDLNNATDILVSSNMLDEDQIKEVKKQINLVSASKNGNTIKSNIPRYCYIARMADRVECIGINGIKRCLEYTLHTGMKFYTNETLRIVSHEEVEKLYYTRYKNYNGISASMIDHYLDKLLYTHKDPSFINSYLNDLMNKRIGYMYYFYDKFVENNHIDLEMAINIIRYLELQDNKD